MQVLSAIRHKRTIKKYLLREAQLQDRQWTDKHALNKTVDEVLHLDPDLYDYCIQFIYNQSCIETSINCEIISISQLMQSGEFNPITASLFIQWYRREPRNAAAFLLQHDSIINLPLMEQNQIIDET